MISSSTGKGKNNKPVNVVILQLLFNQLCIYQVVDSTTKVKTYRLETTPDAKPLPDEAESLPNLKVDGTSVQALVTRIEAYQQAIGMSKPDGWIGKGGKTIKALMTKVGVKSGTGHMKFIRDSVHYLSRTVDMIKPIAVSPLFIKQIGDSWNYKKADHKLGLEYLLTKAKTDPKITFIPELAYMLATAKWETSHTFLPIGEKDKGGSRPYAKEITVNYKDAKNKTTTYKNKYYGRGYVQLTWGNLYQKFDEILGNGTYPNKNKSRFKPLLWNTGFTIHKPSESIFLHPDKVIKKELAYSIMVEGMQKGLFSSNGKDISKVGTHVNKSKIDYANARWVINGKDPVKKIIEYAENFEVCLYVSTL